MRRRPTTLSEKLYRDQVRAQLGRLASVILSFAFVLLIAFVFIAALIGIYQP